MIKKTLTTLSIAAMAATDTSIDSTLPIRLSKRRRDARSRIVSSSSRRLGNCTVSVAGAPGHHVDCRQGPATLRCAHRRVVDGPIGVSIAHGIEQLEGFGSKKAGRSR